MRTGKAHARIFARNAHNFLQLRVRVGYYMKPCTRPEFSKIAAAGVNIPLIGAAPSKRLSASENTFLSK
jgi:hypothetical protein